MSSLTRSDLRVLLRDAPAALLLADGEGRIRTANRRLAELFGYEPGDLVGLPVAKLIPGGLPERPASASESPPQLTGRRRSHGGREVEGRHSDGSAIPVEMTLTPIELEEGPRMIAAFRDVSEHREFREWGTEELEAAEEERLRIAHELHDDLAQRLSALQIVTKLLEEALPEGPEELIAQLRDEVQASADSVRQIVRGLRPPALTELGLAPALRHEARRRLEGRPTELELDVAAPCRRTDEQVELVLYRIAQEAIHNAVQHADPTRVSVRLERRNGRLQLEVEDDGRGFDPERVAREEERYGLIGMRERASVVEGHLDIESAPGDGTRVRAVVPDRPPAPRDFRPIGGARLERPGGDRGRESGETTGERPGRWAGGGRAGGDAPP